mmetsp:Transcript_49937/g.67953  ORF Transcript_49937/g.67953 Transcript_49937/m.67953 type:complete len:125 (-) Transcript_49937:106-480(-)
MLSSSRRLRLGRVVIYDERCAKIMKKGPDVKNDIRGVVSPASEPFSQSAHPEGVSRTSECGFSAKKESEVFSVEYKVVLQGSELRVKQWEFVDRVGIGMRDLPGPSSVFIHDAFLTELCEVNGV